MAFGFGLALPRAKNGFAGPYIVNGFDPTTVTDFANNYFRSGGTQSTFASMFDYTGASTKTMTDSDGKLKWGPHNLLTVSEQFDSASWSKVDVSVTPNAGIAPNGTITADALIPTTTSSTLKNAGQIASGLSSGSVYSFSLFV